MIFSTPAAQAVFEEYSRRITAESARSAAMRPGDMMTRRDEFLLSVGPEAGGFLHSLVMARRPRRVLELGTSYGYSTLFLADAVGRVGGTLITVELADYKQAYAQEMIAKAGLSAVVDFRLGDAVAIIQDDAGPFDLVLLDIWKDLYVPCLDAFLPKLSPEGIIAADNMIEPAIARTEARAYRAAIAAHPQLQSALLPIGSGIELSVLWPADSAKL